MVLMRTEFFETLNPRGRKLTTRLQERWPLDEENDRFEAAEACGRIRSDVHRKADRDAGKAFKPGEAERLASFEAQDKERLATWERASGRALADEEVDALLAAGPPAKCRTSGVYTKCGCEPPPTREEIEARRYWKDFEILGKGYEGSYQEAAPLFKEIGRMDGFDAMFAYRFS